MRGGFLHNEVLIGVLRRELERRDLSVAIEAPVRTRGRITGNVDLLLTLGKRRIAIEAERSARRVRRDLDKAAALHASELWIVVPHVDVAGSIRRLLDRLKAPEGVQVIVFTQGQALQRLREILALIPGSNLPMENKSLSEQAGIQN